MDWKISNRARGIDASGIRKVFELGAKLKNPINLSIGQPDFDAFPEVREAAKQAIESRKSGYTLTQGIAELRGNIAQTVSGFQSGVHDVVITSGVSGGLFLSFSTLLDPGDEVLIPDPYFVMYRDLALLLNASPRYYDTYPDFSLRAENIEGAITPRTKAIVLNSPNNPTGYTFSQSELLQAVEVARKHDLWIIYDEIYSEFSFDIPHAVLSLASYEKCIILNGFSKSHGIPGWRIGYAVAPIALVQQMLKVQQYTFVCAPSPSQWGMVPAVGIDMSEIRTSYKARRDFLFSALSAQYNFPCPGGAFYMFVPVPTQMTGARFAEKCIEHNLLVIPGNVFSTKDTHIRLSYSAPMDVLERGAEVLLRLAK